MPLKSSHVVAVALALGLAGWLASGQFDTGSEARVQPAQRVAEAPKARPLPSVRVRTSKAEPVERIVVINGRTEPARIVDLRSETTGRVVAIGAARGSRVEAGDVLLTVDPRERRAMVEMGEAMLKMRRIEFAAAQKLGQKGFQAETKVAEAEANLEAAEAELEQMRLALEHTRIHAPFAGVLQERPLEIGDFVDIGDEAARVIELDPLIITAFAAERDVGALEVGMAGTAHLVTGAEVEGTVRYVAREADPGTRTFRVELEVANPDHRLPAGVSAELDLTYATVEAHRVPASLLTLADDGRIGVKAVDGEDQVVFHPADIVRAANDQVWLAGIPSELTLITIGQGFVRAGTQVRPVPETADDDAEPAPLVAERG